MKYALLIPALNPSEVFVKYVQDLNQMGAECILVVDDGSDSQVIFDKIAEYPNVIVLHHKKNMGKGKALRTGFFYYIENINQSEFAGVITLDSDGQHTCKDVNKIALAMDKEQDKLILGVRDFTQGNVPPKSKFGNQLTSRIFDFLLGIQLKDTQTGLRGIPNCLLTRCIRLKGNRFEYETAVLIEFCRMKEFYEVDIETIYYEENKETHFNPIMDSIRIYYIIFETFLRYITSSLLSFILDLGFFALLSKILLIGINNHIFWGGIIARICSSIVNYYINRKLVFNSNVKLGASMAKYYTLCGLIGIISAFLVSVLHEVMFVDEIFIKLVVDFGLFFVNYYIQRTWIFKGGISE